MSKPYRWRLRFLVYPEFQITLVVFQWLIIAAVFVSVVFQSNHLFDEMRANLSANPALGGASSLTLLDVQQDGFHKIFLSCFLVGMAGSAIVSVYLSYRLAGPILRLKRYFGEIARDPETEIHELSFRKNDFFLDLPPLVNQATLALRTRSPQDSEPGSESSG